MSFEATNLNLIAGTVYGHPRRRLVMGVALLEVVVSLGLLVFAMAMVGMQINIGLKAARASDIGTRAVMLVDTKLDELYSGVLKPEGTNEEIKGEDDILTGDFGIYYPGFTWRVEFEPTETEGLVMVTVEIGYNESMVQKQVDSPEYEIDIEDDETRIVRTAYILWPVPAKISLERDYGISQEDIDAVLQSANDAVSEAADNIAEGGDTGDLLTEALNNYGDVLTSLLSDPEGFDPRMLADLAGADFLELSGFINSLITGEVNADSIADLLRSQSLENVMNEVAGTEKP
jgi:hypothetical protein